MKSAELLEDGLDRVREVVSDVLAGLSTDQLAFRPSPAANSVCWLIWHLTRVQDDHVAEVAGAEQAWTADGWAARFALPLAVSETGYGHDADRVGAVRATAELLAGYHDAVHARSVAFVRTLTDSDLDRIVDERWDPSVSLGVRLISVIDDDAQHAGQAAFLRGLIT